MGLDDKKLQAIELIIKGEKIADVARIVGVNRKTVYNWLDNKEFKAELDRQTTEQKNQIDNKILIKVEPIINKLLDIALKSSSDKTALDACIYAINRLVGSPTHKTQEVQQEQLQEEINLDVVKDKVGNIINIETKAN